MAKLRDDSDEGKGTTECNKDPRYGFGRVYHTKRFVCNKLEKVGIRTQERNGWQGPQGLGLA